MKLEEALLLANRPWVETALACGDAQEALDVLAAAVIRLQEENEDWRVSFNDFAVKSMEDVAALRERAENAEVKCYELLEEVQYWKDNQDSPYDMKRTIEKLEQKLTKAVKVVEAADKAAKYHHDWRIELRDALRDFYKETE